MQVSVSVLQPGYIKTDIFEKHEKTQDPLTPECKRLYGHLYNWEVRHIVLSNLAPHAVTIDTTHTHTHIHTPFQPGPE